MITMARFQEYDPGISFLIIFSSDHLKWKKNQTKILCHLEEVSK